MQVISVEELNAFIPKVVEDKHGDEKEIVIKVKLGTKLTLTGGIMCKYNARKQTYTVVYPGAPLLNCMGKKVVGADGDYVYSKGSKFTGITEARLVKEFSPQFVKLIKECV